MCVSSNKASQKQKNNKITYKNPTFMFILFPVRLVYHPLADKANDIWNALWIYRWHFPRKSSPDLIESFAWEDDTFKTKAKRGEGWVGGNPAWNRPPVTSSTLSTRSFFHVIHSRTACLDNKASHIESKACGC